MKYVFFWEDRFNNNNFANTSLDPNLSPFQELLKINGEENMMSLDIFEKISKKNPEEFTILCFLTFNIFTLKKYLQFLWKYRKYKKFLFLMEPPVVAALSYSSCIHYFFDRIYTWDDALVDNRKYWKYLWPQSRFGIDTVAIPFKKKKFLTLINGNKTSLWRNELYTERDRAIRYFESQNVEFDLYGTRWDRPNNRQKIFGFQPYSSYRGRVDDKIATLSQYKYSLCFENMKNRSGYITEKIWDSFKARSVPIYWWAANIEEYIPPNTFIDFRQFNWDLSKFIISLSQISEIQYNEYIQNIEHFLWSKQAQKWFDEEWAQWFLKELY